MKNFTPELYRKKVFSTISKFKLVEDRDRIFVGLSGGKDSGAGFYLLCEYVKFKNVQCDIVPFYIRLGDFIPEKVIKVIKKQAELCEKELKIFEIKDFGISFEQLTRLPRPICSSCGVIKRYLMNKIPRENGANKLCTGHHGDDFIVFFMKNILGNNVEWISKFTPLLPGNNKQISRIRPLFFVDGKSNRQFCETINFPFIEEDICPHTLLKQKFDKRRENWYKLVEEIEKWQPNFKEYFLKGIISIAERLTTEKSEIKECKICGEPTSENICAFCRILKQQERIIGK